MFRASPETRQFDLFTQVEQFLRERNRIDHKTAQYLDEPMDICPLSPCSVLFPPPRLAPRVGGFMIKAAGLFGQAF